MTSSTKPEVHNVLHCRQRTEPRPQATWFLRYASGQTYIDRHTDMFNAILRTSTGTK